MELEEVKTFILKRGRQNVEGIYEEAGELQKMYHGRKSFSSSIHSYICFLSF